MGDFEGSILRQERWGSTRTLDMGNSEDRDLIERVTSHLRANHRYEYAVAKGCEALICSPVFYNNVDLIELICFCEDGNQHNILVLNDQDDVLRCLDHTHESIYELNLSADNILDFGENGAADENRDIASDFNNNMLAYLDFYFFVVRSTEGWLTFAKSTEELESVASIKIPDKDTLQKRLETLQDHPNDHEDGTPTFDHRRKLSAFLVLDRGIFIVSIILDTNFGVVKIEYVRDLNVDADTPSDHVSDRYHAPYPEAMNTFGPNRIKFSDFLESLQDGQYPKLSELSELVVMMNGPEFVHLAQHGVFKDPFNIVSVVVEGDVDGAGNTFENAINVHGLFLGRVELQSANFKRTVNLSGSVFQRDLNMANATIEGALLMDQVVIKSGTSLRTQAARRSHRGRFSLDHVTLRGPFRARDLRIGGKQRVVRGRDLVPEVGESMTAFSAQISGDVNLIGLQAGEVKFESASIHGNLDLDTDLLQDELKADLPAAREDRGDLHETSIENLLLTFAKVEGDISMKGVLLHRLDMRGTQARGDVILSPAATRTMPFRASDYQESIIVSTLTLEHADVKGVVDARGLKLRGTNTFHAPFVKMGALRLGCFIAGEDMTERGGLDLEIARAKLKADDIIRTEITGHVSIEGCEVEGNVDLNGMQLEGMFNARFAEIDGQFSAAPLGPYPTDIKNNCQLGGIIIKGSTYLQGIRIEGKLDLAGGTFEEIFLCSVVRRFNSEKKGDWPKSDIYGPDKYSEAPEFFIAHPKIKGFLDATEVVIEGPANLTGVQVGQAPQCYLKEFETYNVLAKYRYEPAVSFRNARIGAELTFWSPMILDQRQEVLKKLFDSEENPNLGGSLSEYTDACIRTRISGDLRLTGVRIGSWLSLINTFVTHRIMLASAHIGAAIDCRWPTDRAWPNETLAHERHGFESYAFTRTDERKKLPPAAVEDPDMDGTVEIHFGSTQCCHIELELTQCQGDGMFHGLILHDLWHRRRLYLPSFLAHGCEFKGTLQFGPRPKREGQKSTQTEEMNYRHDAYAVIPGQLDLSFAHAKLLVLNSMTFQQRSTDYPGTDKRVSVSARREIAKRERRERNEGQYKAKVHDVMHPYLSITLSRAQTASTRMDGLSFEDLRAIDLDLYGLRMDSARVGQLEFSETPPSDEKDPPARNTFHETFRRLWPWRAPGKPSTQQVFPRALDMHGLEVIRWDIHPTQFKNYLDCEPSFQQSSYIMVQRELNDQGFESEAKEVYRKMRNEQAKVNFQTGKYSELFWGQIERVLFEYYTKIVRTPVFISIVISIIFSILSVFTVDDNITVRSEAAESMAFKWEDNPAKAARTPGSMGQGEWTTLHAITMSLRYHIPLIRFHANEKWIARDYGDLILDFRWIPLYGFGYWFGAEECTFGNTGKGVSSRVSGCVYIEWTPEYYATLVELLSYVFIGIIATIFAVSVVQRRAAGQQPGGWDQ